VADKPSATIRGVCIPQRVRKAKNAREIAKLVAVVIEALLKIGVETDFVSI
jgi:hypothetical protein